MTLSEGTIQITFNGAIGGRKFDDGSSHGLSHCMKAVDFIVELPERFLFVEIKDPEAPQVPEENTEEFRARFKRGQLDESLKYKYRDSFLYEWASGRAHKPIDYFVLITGIDRKVLLSRLDALKQRLPFLGPNSLPWSRPIVSKVGVFNMDTWNDRFPQYPVIRV